ncbi:MAG TPA: pyruvate kinase [Oculatellaceae cyanobacterium]
MPFLAFNTLWGAARTTAVLAPQLVVTLGPASLLKATLLAAAGATSFRLNASHMKPADLRAALDTIRRELPQAPVVVDLQGGKMRVGVMAKPYTIREGDRVKFVCGRTSTMAVPVPHRELFESVSVGDTISCDDDRLRFYVRAVHKMTTDTPACCDTEALRTGVLLSAKGVNVIEHPVELTGLTTTDRAICDATVGLPNITFAFSFMKVRQ